MIFPPDFLACPKSVLLSYALAEIIPPFKTLLTGKLFNCSAASPAPAPVDDIVQARHISIPCYTATVTRPIFCPLETPCGVRPECIVREVTTAPCPPRHCSVTPTVTVGGTCPTCPRGCETAFVTAAPTNCPGEYN